MRVGNYRVLFDADTTAALSRQRHSPALSLYRMNVTGSPLCFYQRISHTLNVDQSFASTYWGFPPSSSIREKTARIAMQAALIMSLQGHFFLCLQDFGRPTALDISQHRNDLLVSQYRPVCRHVALVTRRCRPPWNQAVFHHIDQHRIGMVPSMARLVMGWRGQSAIGHALAPTGLPLQRLAMASRAIVRIDRLALNHQGLIRRVDECRACWPHHSVKGSDGAESDGAGHPKDQFLLGHWISRPLSCRASRPPYGPVSGRQSPRYPLDRTATPGRRPCPDPM